MSASRAKPKPKPRVTSKRRDLRKALKPKDPSPTSVQSGSELELVPSEVSPTTGRHLVNTRGLPCLADELYLEIISYFPAFPLPTNHEPKNIKKYGDRRIVLDALSQTCRSLRRVFLRYRWQRIEVYDKMQVYAGGPTLCSVTSNNHMRRVERDPKLRSYAEELVRQLEIVTIREPGLAELVNVLDVLVVDYSINTVLSELARCMSLMPNLHTIHIELGITKQRDFSKTFARYTYPQIRTAYVSHAFSCLLRCPGLKVCTFKEPVDWEGQYSLITRLPFCSSLEILGPILVPPFWSGRHRPLKDYITEIANFENLRDITFQLWRIPTETDLKALWKIPSLTCIKLIFKETMQWRRETEYSVSEWLVQMEQLSQEFAIGEKKRLVLLFEPYNK